MQWTVGHKPVYKPHQVHDWIQILHLWVMRLYPVLGLGSGGRFLGSFPHSNSVLDQSFSAMLGHRLCCLPFCGSRSRNFTRMSVFLGLADSRSSYPSTARKRNINSSNSRMKHRSSKSREEEEEDEEEEEEEEEERQQKEGVPQAKGPTTSIKSFIISTAQCFERA